jgi:hypothetical protein
MNKENVINMHKGVLLAIKRMELCHLLKMDEIVRHHIKQNKPE